MNDNDKMIIYWQSMIDMCLTKLSNLEYDMLESYDDLTEYIPKTIEEIELHMELTSYIKYCERQIEINRG